LLLEVVVGVVVDAIAEYFSWFSGVDVIFQAVNVMKS
jgi:hypothetical protein